MFWISLTTCFERSDEPPIYASQCYASTITEMIVAIDTLRPRTGTTVTLTILDT
jgi:hypothetical protein